MVSSPPNKKRRVNSPASPSITQSTTPRQKYSFFSFPPEIRNEIMSLALTGGHVHLRSKSYSVKLRSHKPPEIISNASTPAVNFLATCQQAYKEGHKMYYSENTFHMPPGSLEEMTLLLNKIKPEYLAMMKHVELRFSLLDLTLSALKEVSASLEMEMKRRTVIWGQAIGFRRDTKNTLYVEHLEKSLARLWDGKLLIARSSFSNLEDLRIRFLAHSYAGGSNSVLVLQGRNADGLIGTHPAICKKSLHERSDVDLMNSYEKVMGAVGSLAASRAGAVVNQRIRGFGRNAFKRWLSPESVLELEQYLKMSREAPSQKYYDLGFRMQVD